MVGFATHSLHFLLSKDDAICKHFIAYLVDTEFNVFKSTKLTLFQSSLTFIGPFVNVLIISFRFRPF